MKKGILTGCDATQEWLLSWWYSNFRKHNQNLPIAFIDFGMSAEARQWCKERGEVINQPEISITTPSEEGVLLMGERWRQVWLEESRPKSNPVWFTKASMLTQTPFYRTLWLDLDCEVLGTLTNLINSPLTSIKLRMRKAPTKIIVKKLSNGEEFLIPTYNSGVVLFESDSYLLQHWAHACKEAGSSFWGDDHIVSLFIAHLKNPKITIPLKYNWDASHWGINPDASILHWQAQRGKDIIRFKMMLEEH